MIFLLLKFLKRHLVFLMDVSVLNETPALCIDSRGTSWMRLHCFALHCLFTLFHFLFLLPSHVHPWRSRNNSRCRITRRRSGALRWICNFSPPTPALELSGGAAPLPPPTHLSFIVSSWPWRPSFSSTLLRLPSTPPPSPPHSSHPSFFSHCHA